LQFDPCPMRSVVLIGVSYCSLRIPVLISSFVHFHYSRHAIQYMQGFFNAGIGSASVPARSGRTLLFTVVCANDRGISPVRHRVFLFPVSSSSIYSPKCRPSFFQSIASGLLVFPGGMCALCVSSLHLTFFFSAVPTTSREHRRGLQPR
jgi:hypothetical protein